jgi:hypothetical protein
MVKVAPHNVPILHKLPALRDYCDRNVANTLG